MVSLRLNAAGDDLDISSGGIELVTDRGDEIVQKLKVRFRFFLGEWFLDRRQGIPYFQSILIKNPKIPIVRTIFRQTVLNTPGIVDLQNFELDFVGATRTLSLSFQAEADTGEVIDFDEDFILNV